jgi:hypothetical protein
MHPNRNGSCPIPTEAIAHYFTPPLPFPALGAPPETMAEYLDRARFPLTTRPDLSPRQQFLADADNLKRMRAYLRAGGTLTDRQQARLTELEAKEIARPALLAQLLDPVGRN